ncbi:MAG TPA: hypothetical protein VIF15_10085 [Polyangiaceae bacterium]
MRPRDRSARAFALAAAAGALLAGGACAGGSSGPTPVPSLASSPGSAQAFEAVREGWRDRDEVNVAELRSRIERFLASWPGDGLVPLARVYLALVAMEQQDYATADRELALGQSLPPGSTRDLWTVARARRARLRGEPEAALELLRPLVGKNVDPLTRAVFEQELTLAALATHRDYEAISYMDAWLRASAEEDREQTEKTVSAIVERLPRDVLVGALQAMRTQRASFGYGVEIERILAQRLVQMATSSGDAELARMLLDPDAGALVVTGDAGAALGELATSRRGLNVVEGRTVGLLLPTESPGLRDESADVLRGVMWALGLPRGVRTLESQPPPRTRSAAGAVGPQAPCAPLEDAPPLAEPNPEQGVRLVTRDDAGSVDRTEVSLDELAGEGAAVVVAGLDAQTAARALRWGEAHAVPVVALVPPAEGQATDAFGFVLGEPRANVVEALARALPALRGEGVAPVVDASEVAGLPPQGGRLGALTLLPPISCDVPATRAGDPRFPVAQWDKDRTRAWMVSGSPSCTRDLVSELGAAHARGVVALTLEAAALPPHPAGLRVVSASAGVIPESAATDARDDELRRFDGTLGGASWWTALGRDAATLARVAVGQLPTGSASDPRAVTERRARARDLLAAARVRLWTTEATGWSDRHAMKRTVCAVEAPATAGR